MELDKPTKDFLTDLNVFSGHRLTRADDLGILVELATAHTRQTTLGELSFLAKFICRTHDLIKRIGSRGDDYDKVLREFSDAVQKAMSLTGILLAEAPQETRRHFESRYMRLMSEDLDSFLALCYDLSWYKNWLIDHPARDPH